MQLKQSMHVRPKVLLQFFSASLNCRSENVRVLPVVITELKLGNIEWHIFPAHFVERADNTALEDRPEALDGLRMDRADDVLASRMVNGSVWIIIVERIIAGILISAKQADLVRNGLAYECGESVGIDVCNYPRDHIALAADGADDRRFAGTDASGSIAAAALIPMPVLSQAADESFIDFDNAAELIDVLHESGSDLVTHGPCCFIRTEAHITLNLQCAHAFLANEHQMDNAIPVPQRLIRVLENRPGDVGKPVGDTISAVHTFPLESHGFKLIDVTASATRAADTFGPSARNEIN